MNKLLLATILILATLCSASSTYAGVDAESLAKELEKLNIPAELH